MRCLPPTRLSRTGLKGSSDVGPDASAIFISGADRAVLRNNWFGISLDGVIDANRISVSASSSDDIVIGGTTAADRNVFAAATGVGLVLTGTDRAQVQGNYFGTFANGTTLTGTNPAIQISLTNAAGVGGLQVGTVIGGPDPGTPGTCDGPCNLVAGTVGSTIRLQSPGGTDPVGQTAVEGNFLGLTPSGAALGGGVGGIEVGGADDVTVGGDATRRNYGGSLTAEGGATNLTVADNFFGLNPAGTAKTTDASIILGALGTPVTGGTVIRNRIARGNGGGGAAIDINANGATVRGNVIGVGTGGENVGGGGTAISVISGTGNQIGGLAAGEGNVIGNAGTGIFLNANSSATTVLGNRVGTDTAEVATYPITSIGIQIQA